MARKFVSPGFSALVVLMGVPGTRVEFWNVFLQLDRAKSDVFRCQHFESKRLYEGKR